MVTRAYNIYEMLESSDKKLATRTVKRSSTLAAKEYLYRIFQAKFPNKILVIYEQ